MSSIGNNTSGKLANLRDSFFGLENGEVLSMHGNVGNGEVEHLRDLLLNSEKARECYQMCKMHFSEDEILELAEERIQKMDYCLVPNDKVQQVEDELCILLGSVVDLELIHELEKDCPGKQSLELER